MNNVPQNNVIQKRLFFITVILRRLLSKSCDFNDFHTLLTNLLSTQNIVGNRQILTEIFLSKRLNSLGASFLAGASETLVQPWCFHTARYFRFNCDRKYRARGAESSIVRVSGTGLARSLIAINHCQNSATRRTTRAAGYHHQSRVLRDQRGKESTGTGGGTEWDMEPVRYFRKLGPTTLRSAYVPHERSARIHRVTNTNSRQRAPKHSCEWISQPNGKNSELSECNTIKSIYFEKCSKTNQRTDAANEQFPF
jgi:hypothetical protein